MNIISPKNAYKIIHKCMFFSERTFDVSNYSSAISSIAFSKCTKFFNYCLIEPSLIITKSRAKLKVILSENYCTYCTRAIVCSGVAVTYLLPHVRIFHMRGQLILQHSEPQYWLCVQQNDTLNPNI